MIVFSSKGWETFFRIHVTQLRYSSRALLTHGDMILTDQRPINYRPTNHRLFTHRPTDPIMVFKRLGKSKKLILQNTNATGKVFRFTNYLINNICFQNLQSLQKNVVSDKMHRQELLIFKVLNFTPPFIFQVCFYLWKFLSRNAFFNSLCEY